MKKNDKYQKLGLISVLSLLLSACTNPYQNTINEESDYYIIPKPVKLQTMDGRFLIDDQTVVRGSEALSTEGKFLATMLSDISGHTIPFKVDTKKGSVQAISLRLDDAILQEEGYRLKVANDGIEILGRTAAGIFYGIQTLGQLLPLKDTITIEKGLTLPCASIEDYPRFPYRGMMLDTGRHFFSKDFVKQYIDMIAMHKMNRFHWHLTEDQGWRIEIRKYPKLTQVGSYRNGTIIGHHPGTGNTNEKYGGYYTQDDIREIVAYAAERHVEVIPEIELPGHSQAAIAAYPKLSCFPNEPTQVSADMISETSRELQAQGLPKIVQESWGVHHDVYCAGKESTFEFLEAVLDEVIPLFPSPYIHIGGDECPKNNWKRCPNCQARMKNERLEDEHGLQSYFVQRIEKYLNSKGRKMIGWDEILEGGLAPNATVMSWRGEKGGVEAARLNHDVIMTPNTYLYFDYYQSPDKVSEPLAIGGMLPVEKVYSYEPLPVELSDDEKKHILGAQANLWTEYITSPDHVEYMVLPRMSALSEVVWSPKVSRDWKGFQERLPQLINRFESMEMRVAKHTLDK